MKTSYINCLTIFFSKLGAFIHLISHTLAPKDKLLKNSFVIIYLIWFDLIYININNYLSNSKIVKKIKTLFEIVFNGKRHRSKSNHYPNTIEL